MGGYAVISGAKPGSSHLSFCSQCEITGDTKRAAFRWRDGSFTFTLIGLQTMRKHSLTQWETIEISEIRPKKQESKGSNYITQYEALCFYLSAIKCLSSVFINHTMNMTDLFKYFCFHFKYILLWLFAVVFFHCTRTARQWWGVRLTDGLRLESPWTWCLHTTLWSVVSDYTVLYQRPFITQPQSGIFLCVTR